MDNFDTYSPTELGDYLSKLNLKGKTIAKIESPSRITSSNKRERLKGETPGEYILTYNDAEIDRPVYLTFDDGRKIGICFCSVSHVFIDPDSDINIEKERDYEKNNVNVSELFKNVIGKKIKDFKIHTAKDIVKASPCFGYIDKNLPKQESYIARLDFEFEDGHDRICFENEYDFTLFHYDWM